MNLGYEMKDMEKVASCGIQDLEQWLHQFPATLEIINVEQIPEYQIKDIDLIWKNTL